MTAQKHLECCTRPSLALCRYSAFSHTQQQQLQQQQREQQRLQQDKLHCSASGFPPITPSSHQHPLPRASPHPVPHAPPLQCYTPQQQAQHLSMSLWALAALDNAGWHTRGDKQAQLRMRPPQAWLAAVLQEHLRAQQQLTHAHAASSGTGMQPQQQQQQGQSSTAFISSAIRDAESPPNSAPHSSSHSSCTEAATSPLSSSSPQSLANIAWALGELHHTPSPAWATAFLPAAAARMGVMSAQVRCAGLYVRTGKVQCNGVGACKARWSKGACWG